MPRFERDGISHYYTVQGMGYPIIFVHGLGLSHQMWIGPAPIFSRHYQVISYDMRGHGGTGTSKQDRIEIRTLSEDLHALYNELGIEKAVLVGYSTGTLICESFAMDHPEKVAGLCLVGSHAKISNNIYMTLKSSLGKWAAQNPQLQKANAYAIAAHNAENLVQRGFFYRIAKRVSHEESLKILEASDRFATTREVSQKMECPVLLVHGSRDRTTEAYAKEFMKRMPNAEISVVEGCNHAVATRAMNAFNVLLDEWLGTLDLSSPETLETTPTAGHVNMTEPIFDPSIAHMQQ